MVFDKFQMTFLPIAKAPVKDDSEVVHNKNSRKNRQQLSRAEYEAVQVMWRLTKFIGPKQVPEMEGFRRGAVNELANGLSSEGLLATLNGLDSFNGYYPEQHDCLYVNLCYIHPVKYKKSRPYIDDYLALVFGQQWEIATGYEALGFLYEPIMGGCIEINK